MRISLMLPPVAVVALFVAACGGAAPTPSPSADPAPGVSTAWLRATIAQAIPPADLFAVGPAAVITGDGFYVTAGPIPSIFPGPLLPNLQARAISEAGRQLILAEAKRLGLLEGQTDFLGRAGRPGAMTARIELTIDGQTVVLTGDPGAQIQCITTPCDAPPGTAAAFADFFAKVSSPDGWLAAELGPSGGFVPEGYALLVGPAPAPDPQLAANLADWPLDVPVGALGAPVLDGSMRCGNVRGAAGAALRPALESANQLTQWTQDVTTSATFGLTVRPIIAGEDACAEVFGPD